MYCLKSRYLSTGSVHFQRVGEDEIEERIRNAISLIDLNKLIVLINIVE